MLLLASVLIGLWLAKPAKATAPTKINVPEDILTGPIIIKDNAIVRPTTYQPTPSRQPLGTQKGNPGKGSTPTKAARTISAQALTGFLEKAGSPLAPYSSQILQSSYYSTIIGVCWIEQYHCTKGPNFNLWGIGPGKRYGSFEESIAAISSLLEKYNARGYDTVEKLNCYYVQPCSSNWLNTVLIIKQEVESL